MAGSFFDRRTACSWLPDPVLRARRQLRLQFLAAPPNGRFV
jgi:hypothetical protein